MPKRNRVLVVGLVAALVLVAAGAVGYWRFGRVVSVPIIDVVAGHVPQRVVGPGTLQARVSVTLAARITATVRQLSVSLIPFLTVRENVALVMWLNGVNRRESMRRTTDLLGYLEIAHRAESMPANLSGGEQQRVAIGRALANEPPLVLADEPTAALDTDRGTKVMALLHRVARERGSAVIAVTHDHRMIAGFDTVYQLDDGTMRRASAAASSAS